MVTKQKKWSAYIMVGNLKFYLCRSMATTEIIKWLMDNCRIVGTNYFMCDSEVFCECK
jgi:hypothetical protein